MGWTRHRLRPAIAGLALIGLPVIGVVASPTSLADDFDCIASISLDCMSDSDDGFTGPGGFGDPGGFPGGNSGGFQAGDLVLPADGGPPQIAAGPAPGGGPVVTAGGDVVVPAGPPIG